MPINDGPLETEGVNDLSPVPQPPEHNPYTFNSNNKIRENKLSKRNSRKDSNYFKRDYEPDVFDNMIKSKEF